MSFLTGLFAKVAGGPWMLYLGGAALVAALGWGGTATWQKHTAESERDDAVVKLEQQKTLWEGEALAAQKAATDAESKARQIEQQRIADREGIAHDADSKIAAAQVAASGADAARVRLQRRVDALVATIGPASCGAAGNPAAPAASEAARGAGLLLADLQRRTDERAGLLAQYADAARTAGQACERAYDSLR